MLTRQPAESVVDNPLVDSPYVAQYDIGVSTPPSATLWLLLDNDHFSTLNGADWAFLG